MLTDRSRTPARLVTLALVAVLMLVLASLLGLTAGGLAAACGSLIPNLYSSYPLLLCRNDRAAVMSSGTYINYGVASGRLTCGDDLGNTANGKCLQPGLAGTIAGVVMDLLDPIAIAGYWGLAADPGGDTQRVYDSSGNARHGVPGTTSGVDATDPTKITEGWQYDGTDDIITVAQGLAVKPLSFTIVVLYTSDTFTGTHYIWQAPGAWALYTAASTVRFEISDDIGSKGQIVGTTGMSFVVGQWHAVAATYDSAIGQARFYWDGAAVGSPGTITRTSTVTNAAATTFGLAAAPASGKRAGFVLYSAVKTPTEIAAVYRWLYNNVCVPRGMTCVAPV